MALNFPGVPSKGIPRSRARTAFVMITDFGGGDLIGSRAKESCAIRSRSTKVKRVIGLLNMKKTSNPQRPAQYVQSKSVRLLSCNRSGCQSDRSRRAGGAPALQFYFLFHVCAGAFRLSA